MLFSSWPNMPASANFSFAGKQFVARMSVSEIRGCPACRFAHAGYAVLARE
jgi:hypothetical protein